MISQAQIQSQNKLVFILLFKRNTFQFIFVDFFLLLILERVNLLYIFS